MIMAGMLGIGLSGLSAAQAALTTTSHNISNANVTGYNRQSVIVGTQDPMFTGAGFFGQGTRIETVRRVYNEFLHTQVLSADTNKSELDSYYSQIKQIDNLLADQTAGLSPSLDSFFKGVQEVAAAPASIPARQGMISNAQALVSRFQSIDERLSQIRTGVDGQMSGSVDTINMLAGQVASLNTQILAVQTAGSRVPANDLQDQRNQLIAQINQQVRVSTTTQSDGSINVFIGSGQALVVGADRYTLALAQSKFDPQRLALGLQLPSGSTVTMPEELVTGGVLGGLLRFRREALDATQNALGRIAVGLTETVNAQHRLGQDLNGLMGGNFFTPMTPTVQNLPNATTNLVGNATFTSSYTNTANLTADDYVMSFDGSNYTLQRQPSGAVAYSGATLPTDFEGFTLGLASGSIGVGDRFLIQPARFAAQNIKVAIGDTRLIAAGAPFVTGASVANSGTASISAGSVVSTTGIAATSPHIGNITLTFDAGANQFVMSGALVGTLAFTPASDASGKTFTLASPNISFSISGVPKDGDVYTLSSNDGGVSDSRNAVALGALATAKTLINGGASLGYAYSQMVSDVGTRTREAQVGYEAQSNLLNQAQNAEQSQSGVNMDEEAANLVRYQQAYQASARVMNIAKTLFDEILGIAR